MNIKNKNKKSNNLYVITTFYERNKNEGDPILKTILDEYHVHSAFNDYDKAINKADQIRNEAIKEILSTSNVTNMEFQTESDLQIYLYKYIERIKSKLNISINLIKLYE